MKSSIFLLLFVSFFVPKEAISQNLNGYKYVIVPIKYDFLEENDKYQLNSLTEFLFEKYGFTTVLQGEEFPSDLKENRCDALTADVLSDSGMFSFVTKVQIILKNCNNQIVFKSKVGRSKLKMYKFSYQQALRDAFSSVEALNYSYTEPTNSVIAIKEKKIVSKADTLLKNRNLVFKYKNETYLLQEEGKGLVLKKRGVTNPIGFLNETSKENYVFRSNEMNGTAYFDESGNLVIEYFDVEAGEMQKMIYTRQAKTGE